jgi:Ohr subfamily peroxiredoxin
VVTAAAGGLGRAFTQRQSWAVRVAGHPEQVFAVGYSACFESALGVVARRHKADVSKAEIESRVMLLPAVHGTFKLAVHLDITLPSIEKLDSAQPLVEAAHLVCRYSNATRGNVDIALSVNGVDLTEPAGPKRRIAS